MVARKQSAFGGYNTSTEGVKAHVVGSCGCKAGWFEMFPSLCKVDRGCAAAWQVGLRGGYPGRRLVFSRARLEGLGKWMMLSAREEKGKTFEKIGIHLISKKHN